MAIAWVVLVGGVAFLWKLGSISLVDETEPLFAEAARQMAVTGDWLTPYFNGDTRFDKPPLIYWLMAIAYQVFGVNEFAARFPNAIAGIVTLWVLYAAGKHIKNHKLGLIWSLFYACSLLPFFYFKSGIIDPWFNLFIFLGIYFTYRYLHASQNNLWFVLLSGLFTGLSVLTKGPVGLLIFGLTVMLFLLFKRKQVKVVWWHLSLFIATFIIAGGLWFILQIINGNFKVITDFITYQIHLFQTTDAGHGGFLLYHFVVLFFGVFPASVLAIPQLLKSRNVDNADTSFLLMMRILFWTVLILFTIVNTKIVHYSSMCYFPLTFLAADFFVKILDKECVFRTRWIPVLFLITGLLMAFLLTAFPALDAMKETIIDKGIISDPFAVEQFRSQINWKGFEWILGLSMALVVVLVYRQLVGERYIKSLYLMLLLPLVYFLALTLYVPRIEEYSQHVFIEFLKDKQGKEVYVETEKMKSYAIYFYTRKQPPENPLSYNEEWLKTGDIDKPVYYIVRNKRANKFSENNPAFELIKTKNGYTFFVRYPKP